MKYRNHMKSIADVLKEFQDARMIVTEEHEKKISQLQEYAGSKFYGKAVKAEETAFAEKLDTFEIILMYSHYVILLIATLILFTYKKSPTS